MENTEALALLRRNLKVLLFHLARGCETPSMELEKILQEVIRELHCETQQALLEREKSRRRLKLVPGV